MQLLQEAYLALPGALRGRSSPEAVRPGSAVSCAALFTATSSSLHSHRLRLEPRLCTQGCGTVAFTSSWPGLYNTGLKTAKEVAG